MDRAPREGQAGPRAGPVTRMGRETVFDYDLAIVGSGGAAFSAAISARRAGLRVVMIERGTVGGTCVNVGCIPSKALLAAAESHHRAGETRFPGVYTHGGPVDFGALVAGKDAIVETLRRQKYADIAVRQEIEIIEGEAHFLDGPALDVDGRRIEAAHYLVATGAEPAIPDIPGLANSGFLTSTTAMELEELPESLIVLGGGPVALEQAQLFAHLGTQVTLVVRSTLARGQEPEIVERLKAAFASERIGVCERAHITTDDRQEYRAAQLLVAAGRRPRTGGLHLDDVGVGVGPRGEVVVGGDMSTSNPRIWAAGDVTGHPQFVYVAAKQGALVVANAFEQAARRISYRSMPRITFTSPTIASVGMTQAEADDAGMDCESRLVDLADIPRAIVSRMSIGAVKLIAERQTGRIVGVHMLADGAGDAILAGVYAIDAGMTVNDLAESWDPYLTIGEGLYLAAQAFTRDLNTLSCCAV